MLQFVTTNFTVKGEWVAALSNKIKPLSFYENYGLPCKSTSITFPAIQNSIFTVFPLGRNSLRNTPCYQQKWSSFGSTSAQAKMFGPQWCFCPPLHALTFCSVIILEHSRYVYSNDWTGPTRGPDKVLTICDLGLLVLICETVQNKYWQNLLLPKQSERI